MEYRKILDLSPMRWDKDAHYLPFYLIYIWMSLSGFGYRN